MDGDLYSAIWMPEMLPPKPNYEAQSYAAGTPVEVMALIFRIWYNLAGTSVNRWLSRLEVNEVSHMSVSHVWKTSVVL